MATDKEQVWLSEYFKCYNATEAARRAGYSSPDKQGWQKKEKFAEEIRQHLEEKALSAEAALALLADHATGTMEDFLEIWDANTWKLDLKKAKDSGKLHLIKELGFNQYGKPEIKIYDAQSAILNILKIHGKFKDVVEQTVTHKVKTYHVVSPDDWDDDDTDD